MQSFSEQLSQYIERRGISDAELARRLGVSRQTIFRWREGETQRPRHREDVTRLARTLQLSSEERDQILIAAGFLPEGTPGDVFPPEKETSPAVQLEGALPFTSRWTLLLIAALIIAGLFLLSPPGKTLTAHLPWNRTQPAAPGELLIAISPFHNFSGLSSGFNMAGRIREALQSAFEDSELNARVEVLNEQVEDKGEAQQEADRLRAALVIWGEYDSGRVVAHTTFPSESTALWGEPRQWLVASSSELTTVINQEVPAELRSAALTVLGQVHLSQGHLDQAAAAFQRALQEPMADERTQAVNLYYLGLTESQGPDPSQDEVIAYYSEALARRPGLVSALNNRGLAYLARDEPGDLERAAEDFRQAAELAPTLAAPVINMAAVHEMRASPQELDDLLMWLERAEELRPEDATIQNDLCWYYSLDNQPERALPHCDQALVSADLVTTHESRGLALALLGRHQEAATELQTYLSLLEQEDTNLYEEIVNSRKKWIHQLENDQNPFDAVLLEELLTQ